MPQASRVRSLPPRKTDMVPHLLTSVFVHLCVLFLSTAWRPSGGVPSLQEI